MMTTTYVRGIAAALIALMAAGFVRADDPDVWETISPGGDTACATGTPFSFHVRRADPGRVMVYFNGGGACWSGETCDITGSYGREPTYRPFATAAAGNDPRGFGGASGDRVPSVRHGL